MSLNARFTTYICFFAIVILFLFLGYSSVSNIRSAKLDPETYYISCLIKCGDNLNLLADRLSDVIKKSKSMSPYKVVKITSKDEQIEELTQIEVIYDEVNKLSLKIGHQNIFLEKAQEKEFADKYSQALQYYIKALETMTYVADEIIYDIDETDLTTSIIPRASEFELKLGNNAQNVKHNIKIANKYLKK